MNVRAKSEVIRAWQNHSFSEFGSRNRHPKPVPSPQEELVSLPSIHDLEDRPLELNEQVQRLENAKANVTSVIEDELVAPKRPPGIKIRKVLPRTRIRPGTDPDSDLLSNVDDTSRSGVKPIKMQEAQPTTGVLIDLEDTQTESLPIVRHENDAWAMSFLLKQIQASPLGSAVNEITRSSVDTHLDLLHASSASPIPAEANTEGEIREQLAAVDETRPILHSVMRNKSGRQRAGFPPLVGTDLQAERHSIGRGVSTERRRQIESLFRALKPLLETAGEYPGILSLEFQLGLVLIPRPPQKLEGRYKDVERLQTKLSPRAGLPAPATVFFERLTTSAADIDYIVDLEVNGVRLFATQPDLREVRYEFHCESKGGDLVVNVYPDRGGNHLEILTPSELLGSVHISFPGHVWDAAAALRGQMKQSHGIDRETEDRVKNLFSALWAKPEEGRVRLHTHIPDDKLSVKKVLVKRCTRYRHCRREDIKLGFYADQDLFLQVTETQDLIINHYKGGHIEAYYAPDSQMISEQRQWWEASIISPVLNSSLNPEKGRQNTLLKPWEVSGLLGSDRGLVSNDIDDSAQTAFTAEKVGPAGPAGLGGLLDLTDAVVKNIDGVGYWNSGPCATPSRTSTTHDAAVGGLVRPSYSMISSGPEPPLNPDKGLIRVPKTSERGANAQGSVADPTFW
ncbi:hypothetical protein N7492_001368 [Penicillium capsulatum]|uniref:Uncharacterized protein n=1 Tax=Penicillium capsulatum TaxID=69766 RepID=A0A9W9ITJ1_9EURO|nr:hypothetical protein N7492_001368 [Penicillium capsulatum]